MSQIAYRKLQNIRSLKRSVTTINSVQGLSEYDRLTPNGQSHVFLFFLHIHLISMRGIKFISLTFAS